MSRRDHAALFLMTLIALGAAAFLTYGLALIGEPQSSWLWCDVLKACPTDG